MVAAALMAVTGAIMLMVRYKAINAAFAEDWEEEYQITGQEKAQDEPVVEQMEVEPEKNKKKAAPVEKKASTSVKAKSAALKKAPASKSTTTTKATKTTAKKSTSKTTKKPATRTKKSS
jgi:hypothetical protein